MSDRKQVLEVLGVVLKQACEDCTELAALAAHMCSFAWTLTRGQAVGLLKWLETVRGDDLPALHAFANGSERDA